MSAPTAKKGDMAMIVGMIHAAELNGQVVPVLSDPYVVPILRCCRTGEVLGPDLCNQVELGRGEPFFDFIATRSLVPIRDPDADTRIDAESNPPDVFEAMGLERVEFPGVRK